MDPAWHATTTLTTLRTILEAAVEIRHVVSRRSGLSPVELAALEQLSHGPVGPAELARRLEVTGAAATGIADRLSRRGHLDRVADADDRRRTQLHITDSAQAEVQRHLRPMFAGLASLDAELSDEERVVVERYLSRVLSCLDGVIHAPEPSGDRPT